MVHQKTRIRFTRSGNDAKDRYSAVIAQSLAKGKRHFGVAGGSLTWMNAPDMKSRLPEGWKPKVLDAAMKAEQKTSVQIREWMADKPNAVLIDSVHIAGKGKETLDEETGLLEGGDTDHVLLIGNSVFVIDTKNWKKSRYEVSDDGSVVRGGGSFPGGRVHIEKALPMWLDFIENEDVVLSGIVYIHNEDPDDTRVFRGPNWYKHPWSLLEEKRFTDFLDKKYEALGDDTSFIDANMVAQITACCVKPYDPRVGVINDLNFN